jgi:Leucine-rich repeat (LRR) protein
MSYKIALQRIRNWKEGKPLKLAKLNLTEIPKEISSLINLTWVDLDHNKITDLSPLASLTNLTFLYLQNNQITDVSPLASLTKLIWLDLQYNKITDVSPLASLTNCKVHY